MRNSPRSLRIRILIGCEERSFTPDPSASLGTSCRSGQTPFLGCLVNNKTPSPLCFSQVFILKGDKVLCFDTLSQVFILKNLRCTKIVQNVLFFVGGDPAGSPEWGPIRVAGVQFMQKYSTTGANCQGI
jgi:hypothetical protein